MTWHFHLAHFLGGSVPGKLAPSSDGRGFRSSSTNAIRIPAVQGLSRPIVNVAWALANLAGAYLLLLRVGPFDIARWSVLSSALPASRAWLCSAPVHSRAFARRRRSDFPAPAQVERPSELPGLSSREASSEPPARTVVASTHRRPRCLLAQHCE